MVAGPRAGVARPGCLALLVLFGIAGYVAIVVGAVHLQAYRFRDSMVQQARFAERTSDAEIIRRLQARADSLNLPRGAHHVHVRRSDRAITIWAEYDDTIDLSLFRRTVRLTPRADHAW